MSDTEQQLSLALVDAALVLQKAGDHETALELLAKARDRSPGYAPIYLLVGVSYRELDRPEEAESNMRMALSLQPEYPEAQQALGLLLSAYGEWDGAADLLKAHLEKEPTNVVSLKTLGKVLWRLDRREEAIQVLQDAWQRTGDAKIGLELGHNLGNLGRLDEAETLIRQVVDSSKSAESLTELGAVLSWQDRCREAIRPLQQAIEKDPAFDRAWRGLAYCYRNEGELERALEAIEHALSLDGQHFRNWQIYGSILLALGKPQEALEATQRGLELLGGDEAEASPQLRTLLVQELVLLIATKQAETALVRAESARERFPAEEGFAQMQTSLLIASGDYEDALRVLDDAFKAGSPHDGVLAPWMFETLHLLGRPGDAWAFVEPTLATHTEKRLEILSLVGVRIYRLGKTDIAREIFLQLHSFARNDPQFANNLGFILIGDGKLADAREFLLQALAMPTKTDMHPVILANLGYLSLLEGQLTQAMEYLKESASLPAAADKAILRIAYWKDDSVMPDPVPYPTRLLPIWTAVKANQVTLALAQDFAEEAQALAQQIVEETPDSPWGHAMQGWVLRAKGELEQARHVWRWALERIEDRQDREAVTQWLKALPN